MQWAHGRETVNSREIYNLCGFVYFGAGEKGGGVCATRESHVLSAATQRDMWIAVVRPRRAFCCSRWQCWEQELGCHEVAAVSTGRVPGATCWRVFEPLSFLVDAVVFTGHLLLPRSRYSIEDLRRAGCGWSEESSLCTSCLEGPWRDGRR